MAFMNAYFTIEVEEGSKYWKNDEKGVLAGLKDNTFYYHGDIKRPINQNDIEYVWAVKNTKYKKIDAESFINLYLSSLNNM